MTHASELFARRQRRVRYRLRRDCGDRLRLSVFRSNNHIYAQIIDDRQGRTLCAASSLDKSLRDSLSVAKGAAVAEAVGRLVAERALAVGIGKVVFDRGGYRFHGRIKALADAARAAGLVF